MNQPQCELLEWDTEFFGFPIARISAGLLTPDELRSVLSWCNAEHIRCLYWLVEGDAVAAIRLAEEHQFRFVDIRLTLDSKPDAAQHRIQSTRRASEEDLSALATIAGYAHADTRFFRDPNFPRDRCRELYAVWVQKSIRGYAERVFVAEHNGMPAGYITCHAKGDVGEIGLIAVAESARGKGLGSELIAAALQYFAESGTKQVRVVTQGHNVAAQRLYQRYGFLTCSVQIWYHRWFPQI